MMAMFYLLTLMVVTQILLENSLSFTFYGFFFYLFAMFYHKKEFLKRNKISLFNKF